MAYKTNALKRIRKLYASVPKIECKKLCRDCCGPILMTNLELEAITKRVGYTPLFVNHKTMTCPMLDSVNGTCTIYEDRPLICRIWACTEDLKCPHGCVPERWLSREEASEMIRQAERLSR